MKIQRYTLRIGGQKKIKSSTIFHQVSKADEIKVGDDGDMTDVELKVPISI